MTLNFYKNKFLIITLAAFLLIASVSSAKAQATAQATSSKTATPVCELNKALNNLLKVKDSDLSGTARDRAEFRARKTVLEQTIVCSFEEMGSAKNKLSDIESETENDLALLAQFLGDLEASGEVYNTYSNQIATTTGLLEVKDLAEEILEWRNDYYLPLLKQVNDFILLMTSERAVDTASARFNKISTSLSILRLSQVASIKTHLDSAEKLTQEAAGKNNEARAIVESYLRPQAATSTAPTSTVLIVELNPDAATSTALNTEAVPTSTKAMVLEKSTSTIAEVKELLEVADLVKSSLNSLKLAYGDYLKISTLVRQILGI